MKPLAKSSRGTRVACISQNQDGGATTGTGEIVHGVAASVAEVLLCAACGKTTCLVHCNYKDEPKLATCRVCDAWMDFSQPYHWSCGERGRP